MEALYETLRSNISVVPQGKSYFAIRYQGLDPRKSFLIAQRLGQLFLEESNRRKRHESRNAFDFIEKQVRSYEQQINQTEQELKEFLSRHTEGTEEEANRRMAQLRRDIDSAELELQEVESQERSLQEQIETLPATVATGGGSSDGGLTERINRMEERLDQLKLQYEDSYPDVANLERQIAELKQRRERMQSGEVQPSDDSGLMFNPVYQELKTELSRARTRKESLRTRISALERRLAQQEQRMEVIQGNKAERSELTRDLQVNREIYNDLLKRREKARVSMSLDIEGQGLSYEITEQARYPVGPAGLQFNTFASVGWLLGLLAPIVLLVGLLQVDPRVRSPKQIQDALEIPLLGSIPLVKTPFERRRERRGYLLMVVIVLLIVAGYLGVVSLRATGALG